MGMDMKRELTCIVCPMGCALTAEIENGQVVSVTGNTCPRGAKYAEQECTHPERVLTTTAAVEGGGVLPVRTDRAVPKEMLFDCMAEVNQVTVHLPISIGTVIIEHIAGTEANLVAAKNLGRGN